MTCKQRNNGLANPPPKKTGNNDRIIIMLIGAMV